MCPRMEMSSNSPHFGERVQGLGGWVGGWVGDWGGYRSCHPPITQRHYGLLREIYELVVSIAIIGFPLLSFYPSLFLSLRGIIASSSGHQVNPSVQCHPKIDVCHIILSLTHHTVGFSEGYSIHYRYLTPLTIYLLPPQSSSYHQVNLACFRNRKHDSILG